jgi:predicted enzyme related to lactoylglutathione lyase
MKLIPILAPATGTFLAKLLAKGLKGEREMARTAESTRTAQERHAGRNTFVQAMHGVRHLLLSGPQASGSRPMPDGERQEPGGWNRVVLRVEDLEEFITVLKGAGLHFKNNMETGPGGRQIQMDDPDGNPIELFEPVH